jgi:SanA protein
MRKLLTSSILLTLFLILPWAIISWTTRGDIYRSVDTVPYEKVWLLLGTTPSVNGMNNIFFTTRIEAAKALYEKGKISHILVSGDNSRASYNEPESMRKALIKAWVKYEDITLDYAGFDTLDSVVRASRVFGQTGGYTIISQPFHVERALFLAHAKGIDAIGFGAANVSLERGLRTYIREIGARWKAVIDILLATEPKILGDSEKLTGE